MNDKSLKITRNNVNTNVRIKQRRYASLNHCCVHTGMQIIGQASLIQLLESEIGM